MFDITNYFDWENIPAVVGNVSETHSSGFYIDVDDNTWNKAKPVTILDCPGRMHVLVQLLTETT